MKQEDQLNELIFDARERLKEREYWLDRLSGDLVKSSFPFDRIKKAGEGRSMETLDYTFTGDTFSRLMHISNKSDIRLYILLMTGVVLLLEKYTGNKDIIVGAPIYKQQVEGDFINKILALRNQLRDDLLFKELLLQVSQTNFKAVEHINYPIETIPYELNMSFQEDEFPLFDVAVLVENIHDKSYIDHLNLNVIFSFLRTEDSIKGVVEYNANVYHRGTMERIITHYRNLMQRVISGIDSKISDISILSEAETRQLLFDFNDTRANTPSDKTIHQLFEEQVERSPGHTALIGTAEDSPGGSPQRRPEITYQALNERANQLAQVLRDKGIIAETIAAVWLDRSIELITAVLAVLKAGGAYLPIDIEYPADRINYLLEDSHTKLLLTGAAFSDKVKFAGPIINAEDDELYRGQGTNPEPLSCADNLAYVIYTSGTTGKPKGVMIEHGAVVNYVWWAAKTYVNSEKNNGETINFPLYSSISFDLTVTSIFTPLITGNAIVVYKGREKEFLIEQIIEENRVGVIKLTPSHLYVIKYMSIDQSDIRCFIVGGEELETQIAREIDTRFGGNVDIYNEYGPTEAAVGCVCYKFEPAADNGRSVPIGVPTDNVQIYVMDRNLKPVPLGVCGEIYISGDGVARGYLNSVELTAEKFITFYRSDRSDKSYISNKIYQTGDMARWLPDGNLEYLGRADQQVKIRGYRIELGEIEQQLLQRDDIKEAVVIARDGSERSSGDEKGDPYLCAYFVSDSDLRVSHLREYLLQYLPDYMIPLFFVPLEEIPLTSNGKVDRKALPEPDINVEHEYVAPGNEIEVKLAGIWSEVLGIEKERIGIDANFFELGGQSLKQVVLISRIHRELNVKIPLSEIFKRTSIRDLSEYIKNAAQVQYISIDQAEKKEYYVTSSAQKRIFFLNRIDNIGTSYNVPFVFRLEGDLDKEKFNDAIKALIRRHETLRTSFVMIGEELIQRIHAFTEVEFKIEYYDISEVEVKVEEEVIITGTPAAGRRHADLDRIIGVFINTLALKNYTGGEMSFKEFLGEVKEKTLAAFSLQEYPYEELVEALAVERDTSRNPLFDTMFALQNMYTPGVEIPGLKLKPYEFEINWAKFDMTLAAIETTDDISFALEYSTKLFKRETIERFIHYFKRVVLSVLNDPGIKISGIDILAEEEKHQLLARLEETREEYPGKTIVELFEEQVRETPDHVALLGQIPNSKFQIPNKVAAFGENVSITYKELNEKSDQLAQRLREKGMHPGMNTIAVVLASSPPGMVLGILAILKSGGAYVLLEPGIPSWRMNYILKDSGSPLLVTDTKDKPELNLGIPLVILDMNNKEIPSEMTEMTGMSGMTRYWGENVKPLNPPGDTACVWYESGAGGFPRGLMMTHQNLVNVVEDIRSQYESQHQWLAALTYTASSAAGQKDLPGDKYCILDPYMNLVPAGTEGEIYLGGSGVCRGYLNRLELTAENFIKNPFLGEQISFDRLYRTGNRGKYLPGGDIVITGRSNGHERWEIGGHLVEPDEIRFHVLAFQGIKEAVVTWETSPKEEILIAYYEKSPGLPGSIAVTDLKRFLSERLPAYMIPVKFLELEKIPLTSTGEPDRYSLSHLDTGAFVEPRTPTEKKLSAVWSKILGEDHVNITSDFFQLGGNSIKALMAVQEINEAFDVNLLITDIFERPTIEQFSGYLDSLSMSTGAEVSTVSPIEAMEEQEYYDVSHAQKRLWVVCQFPESSVAYNMPMAFILNGKLNEAAFNKAFDMLVERHEMLRTIFITVADKPKQKILSQDETGFTFDRIDLRKNANREEQAGELVNQEAWTAFDLNKGPLVRAKLIRLEEDKYLFLFNMHHIISDGWSLGVMIKEVSALYNTIVKGHDHALPPLKIQYKDFSTWQNKQLQGEELSKHQGYWVKQFKPEVPVLQLPYDYPRPRVKTFNGDVLGFLLSPGLTREITDVALSHETSLFITLLASVQALLYRYTGQEDMIVGSPISGRGYKALEGQVGFYVNMLALRTSFKSSDGFEGLLGIVKKTCLAAYEHDVYPFDQLVDDLELERDMSRSPLFDVLVSLNPEIETLPGETFEKVTLENYPLDPKISKFDLFFAFSELPEGLYVTIEYNTDLFLRSRMQRMVNHYQELLGSLVKDMQAPLYELNYLSDSEKHQLLVEFNNTCREYPHDKTIYELFAEEAARSPETIALVGVSGSGLPVMHVTYKELKQKSHQLASLLEVNNVCPGMDSIVGIMVERSVEMVIGILGILMAGGAYLPIDAEYPRERLRYMLADSDARILLSQSGEVNEVIGEGELVLLDVNKSLSTFTSPSPSSHQQTSSTAFSPSTQLGYILYTSGTTGQPKAVMVEQRSVIRLVKNTNFIEFKKGDRILQTGALDFDASTLEIWGSLLNGLQLREFLQERLPGYMIPAYFIFLERFPLTPNGKIQRRALPDPEAVYPGTDVQHAAPRNALEEKLVEIWAAVLSRNSPGINDDFFMVGGDSIKAIQVASRMNRANYKVDIKDIYQYPTILELAPTVRRLDQVAEPVPVEKEPFYPGKGFELAGILEKLKNRYDFEIADIYPLTPMQEGMLFHFLVAKNSSIYFEQFSYRLHGYLDITILEKSLNRLFQRHHILRTAFIHQDIDRPVQVVLANRQAEFYFKDICDRTDEEKQTFIRQYKAKDIQRSFDLEKDVLMRAALIKVKESQYEFTWSFHHILLDGWCIGILTADFFEFYYSMLENRECRLMPVKSYREYILWLEKQDQKKAERFWEKYLQNYNEATYISAMTQRKTTGEEYKDQRYTFTLDSETTNHLKQLAGRNRVTVNTVFQVLWGIILGKYTGKQDVVFGAVVSGRPAELEGVETMVGLFINTVPVRIRLGKNAVFKQVVREVQEETLQCEPFHYYPLARIQTKSALKQELLDHILVFENFPATEQIDGLLLQSEQGTEKSKADTLNVSNVEEFGLSNYDFNIIIGQQETTDIIFSYNTHVYEKEFVQQIAGYFNKLIEQVLTNPHIEINELTILDEKEISQLIKMIRNESDKSFIQELEQDGAEEELEANFDF
ncbi:MAG: amino acid adenylation domain-containing protein [Candidatus Aminicenantes bacterium]|nr:MAG: amino acid adenylation domain-containing protein [Candidatus Aminicenantes bacterium]